MRKDCLKKRNKAPLSLAQYERLYRVLASIAEHWGKDQGRACVFYSVVGAALMHKHYHLNAQVVCGSGAVLLEPASKRFISWFTHGADGSLLTGPDAFHTWIECDSWLIDLMAPNYREAMVRGTGRDRTGKLVDVASFRVPRKMLQKPIEQTRADLSSDLTRAGECCFVPDQAVTSSVIERAFEKPQLGNFIQIALAWHRPVPLAIDRSLDVGDSTGSASEIRLIDRELVGAW